MMAASSLKPPSELGKPGRALWQKVTSTFEFVDPRELVALRHSCLLEDDLDRLRAELATSTTLVVKGSTGQPVETPLLGAIRKLWPSRPSCSLPSQSIPAKPTVPTPAGRWSASGGRTMANYRRPADRGVRDAYMERERTMTALMVRLSDPPGTTYDDGLPRAVPDGGATAMARLARLESGEPARVQGWQIGLPSTDFSLYLLDAYGRAVPAS